MIRIIAVVASTLTVVLLLASVSACSNDETTTTTTTSVSTPAETSTTTSVTTSSPSATTTTETSEPAETTTTSPALDEAAVRAFADDVAATTMEGLSEADLEKYTRHANDEFKEAVTQEMVDAFSADLEAQLGSFVGLTFLRWETADNYILVHYSAEYTQGTVGVLMTFDEDHRVAGQFFE